MMKRVTVLKHLLLSLFGAVMIASCALPAVAQPKTGKDVYRGNIFYFGGGRNITTDFTLTITSYTPESEVRRLQEVLRIEGQDDFQKIVGKEKRGTIQVGTGLGLDLNAVWVTQTGEGRKLSAIAERWVGFGELRRGTRSTDYPFTYIELWIQEDGGIEGTLFPAARVRGKSGDTIEVENFGIYPARLTNVKQRRK
jgi:hypothetical protein